VIAKLQEGDPHDPLAGNQEGGVSGAVALEGRARLVELPAVHFADQARLRPEGVDLEALYQSIHLREGEIGESAQALK
jgi:hypothetical protein